MAALAVREESLWFFAGSLFLKQLGDIGFNLVWCGLRGEALQHMALLVNEKLGEVPFDAF
ncbi:hypothetical protein D3C81_1800080 [compost metagenome]